MPLLLPMALDVVRSPRVATHRAAILLLRYPKRPGLVRMVCPHVAVGGFGLGPASAAKVAFSALRVVVDVLAVGGWGCQLLSFLSLYFQPSKTKC